MRPAAVRAAHRARVAGRSLAVPRDSDRAIRTSKPSDPAAGLLSLRVCRRSCRQPSARPPPGIRRIGRAMFVVLRRSPVTFPAAGAAGNVDRRLGQDDILTSSGTSSSATMLMILISGLTAGPAVSLYGSPTVSPVTAALCASEPLPP